MKKRYLAAVAALFVFETAAAQTCSVPVDQIHVEGIRLGESAAAFKKRFPNPMEFGLYSPEKMRMSDYVLMIHDISLRGGKVSGFKLSFDEYDAAAGKLSALLSKRYSLPQQGWKKSGSKYAYRCNDYLLTVRQTGGNRGGMGAILEAELNWKTP